MRQLIYLVIIAAAAYVGYSYYAGKGPVNLERFSFSKRAETEEPSAPDAKATPEFKSKIALPSGSAPGEKRLAKPGIFYMLERVSAETPTGIVAAVPGDEVRLMARNENGTMKITNGKAEFVVKASQVTNDLDLARAVERNYALTHPANR
jgi:hypothetical protein